MRQRRIAAAIAIVAALGIGLVLFRGRAKTCPPISFARGEKIYAISSKDIGDGLSCQTARTVARDSAGRRFARHVRGWSIVYHRSCQCYTGSRTVAGRRTSFTFNATKRPAQLRTQ